MTGRPPRIVMRAENIRRLRTLLDGVESERLHLNPSQSFDIVVDGITVDGEICYVVWPTGLVEVRLQKRGAIVLSDD
jgi:hypothetical protein